MSQPKQQVIDLSPHGLTHLGRVSSNLSAPGWIELALNRGEGHLADSGALIVRTGIHTGRSPKDKYIVRDTELNEAIDWGEVNQPITPKIFHRLLDRARSYLQGKDVFVQDGYVCADPKYRLPLRVVTEYAWQALFARCLFLRWPMGEEQVVTPEWLILAVPGLHFDGTRDGIRSSTAICVSFSDRIVLIGGTHYAGEIKKSVFTILNALLPMQGVLSMHCSANIGDREDVALFFGLSGTGKTTLSADPERRLIGDDEHGWSDDGVFNIEGGCYAKTIRLTAGGEPQIWNAIRFGSLLENVPLDPLTRIPDFHSEAYTENTRAAYPIDFIPGAELSGRGGHPSNVFFLTCDAFGVLPPISRLTPEQAMQYFLMGYTAKVAGTEKGVKEPKSTYSTCFGAPFLPLPARVYAALLGERLTRYQVPVWLINTGWTGGPYGVGHRMSLPHTRTILRAALSGSLNDVPYTVDRIFGLAIPQRCPGVPREILDPRAAWSEPEAYDRVAQQLADDFVKHIQSAVG